MDPKADLATELAKERTLMASERTFLAWIRTGLAGVGGGIAIIRLITFHDPLHQTIALIVSKVLMGWGIAIFIFSLINYKQAYKKLDMPLLKGTNFLLTVLVLTLVIVSCLLFVII
jgi:putative membrane protein